jgi:hypothetical protein
VTHCDADQLCLLALGEPASVDRAHLAACPDCRDELAALKTTVGVARSGSRADVPQAPPPQVWARVADELELSPAVAAAGTEPRVPPAPAGTTGPAPVVPLRPRPRQNRLLLLAAAAAVSGLVLGAGTTWFALRDEGAGAAAPDVVATARLQPLPDWRASGTARVLSGPDGQRTLVVEVRAPEPAATGFREVWLLDRAAKRLVSLGVLAGPRGTYVLPDALDLSTYPVVDVSQEPADGDPAHSGDSIVRGALDA